MSKAPKHKERATRQSHEQRSCKAFGFPDGSGLVVNEDGVEVAWCDSHAEAVRMRNKLNREPVTGIELD